MLEPKILIIDTETTGLERTKSGAKAEVIELAYIHLGADFRELARWEKQFKPLGQILPGAMTKHFITLKDLEGCLRFTPKILPSADYYIGHNVDFDLGMLEIAPLSVKAIDTLAICKSVFPGKESYSLGALYLDFAMDQPDLLQQRVAFLKSAGHSALGDCTMVLSVVEYIQTELAVDDIELLYELSESCRVPETMPFGKHKGTPINDVPKDYIQWVLYKSDIKDTLESYLKKALEDALNCS